MFHRPPIRAIFGLNRSACRRGGDWPRTPPNSRRSPPLSGGPKREIAASAVRDWPFSARFGSQPWRSLTPDYGRRARGHISRPSPLPRNPPQTQPAGPTSGVAVPDRPDHHRYLGRPYILGIPDLHAAPDRLWPSPTSEYAKFPGYPIAPGSPFPHLRPMGSTS